LVILGITACSALRATLSSADTFVTVTITNDGEHAEVFLKWNSPFDELAAGRAFSVNDASGETLPYTGRVGKRGKPQENDYIAVSAGETVSTTVDLSEYFTFPETAQYEVQMIAGEEIAPAKYSFSTLQIESNVVSINAEASPAPASIEARSVEISFVSCTAAQETTVTTAWNLFKTLAPKAKAEAAKGSLSSSYITYFGAFAAARNTEVVKCTTNEVTASQGAGYAFNCKPPSCGGTGTYAYVYPNQPTTVYLCDAFWKAPTSGWDSTPGVIVHEVSHFTVIGGTSDYAYGNAAAKSLATSNPARAVLNADNYEYFAESL